MIYRENNKNKDKISLLGFGCMRLPKKGRSIDFEASEKLILDSIEKGVNYFDTAYIYNNSEKTLGNILHKHNLRDKVYIATKLPLFMCKSYDDFDRLFNIQLDRLKTDRIDYYLLHMLSDTDTLKRLLDLGIDKWIKEKKETKKIINLGFSYHGGKDEFKHIIDMYDFDFCMIQYNYLDEHNQATVDGLKYANKKGIPVFVMEPLRGGMLVNGIPTKAKSIFNKVNKDRPLSVWAFRWLYSQSEINLVLSGMNSQLQLEENVNTVNNIENNPLTDEEIKAYKDVVKIMREKIKIPCTKCGYCMPCPVGVDIPNAFSCYNEIYTTKYSAALKAYFMTTGITSNKQSNASLCIKCGKCESHCPQHIEIRKNLKRVSRKLESFWYKPIKFIVKKVLK